MEAIDIIILVMITFGTILFWSGLAVGLLVSKIRSKMEK